MASSPVVALVRAAAHGLTRLEIISAIDKSESQVTRDLSRALKLGLLCRMPFEDEEGPRYMTGPRPIPMPMSHADGSQLRTLATWAVKSGLASEHEVERLTHTLLACQRHRGGTVRIAPAGEVSTLVRTMGHEGPGARLTTQQGVLGELALLVCRGRRFLVEVDTDTPGPALVYGIDRAGICLTSRGVLLHGWGTEGGFDAGDLEPVGLAVESILSVRPSAIPGPWIREDMPPRTRVRYAASACVAERLRRANWQDMQIRRLESDRFEVRHGFLTPELAADFLLAEAPHIEWQAPESVHVILGARLRHTQRLLDQPAAAEGERLA